MKRLMMLISILLVAAMLLTSSACIADGEVIVTVTNQGPATVFITFFDIQTTLTAGLTETYTVTLPGKHETQQILTWYPLIHPNRIFTQYVVLKDGENVHIDVAYDPDNPPAAN